MNREERKKKTRKKGPLVALYAFSPLVLFIPLLRSLLLRSLSLCLSNERLKRGELRGYVVALDNAQFSVWW